MLQETQQNIWVVEFSAWLEQTKKLEAEEITKEEYDQWCYNYPKFDTSKKWAKIPSLELSDFIVDALKKEE